MNAKERERLLSKIEKGEDCWAWTGTHNSKGYSSFKYQGRMQTAHRLMYELFVGVIPDGYQVDHTCFNKGCVNPDHLQAVTPSENTRRAWAAGRCTTRAGSYDPHWCPHGHERSKHGYRTRFGVLQCRVCRSNQKKRARAVAS